MANGTYGIRKPARIEASDVDIYYHYRPTRGSDAAGFSDFKRLDASSVLSPSIIAEEPDKGVALPGMYNLRLPLNEFNKKGIYTIYITPKEISARIEDVSTLTGNYTNIRGIVVREGDGIDESIVGWRVEYIDDDGNREEDYRIITSCNRCEPVSQNVAGSAMQKSVRYRFNNSSNLLFCTLTPSTAMSFKSSDLPAIGRTGQEIRLVNTKFNPVMIEIEMVTHDADTISTMLEGSQTRDLDHGIITTFDEDGNIYHQAAYGNITNPDTGLNHDFKIKYDIVIQKEKEGLQEIKEQINGSEV